ncbi:MAG TPA: lipid-A-disaccharide synthase, partial [Gammaproteobacteria bacterium]
MNNTPKQVLIVAGEASGDHHAARLVEELHQRDPDVHFAGIGGERMRHAGVEILVDSADMAVVGLVEVLANYRFLKGVLDRMRRELRERRPDMLILVDYPDFNLRLAATAKELGIKVLYYISPQVWAWRQKRVYKIKKLVDMMAVVFPFEVPFYEQAGVP